MLAEAHVDGAKRFFKLTRHRGIKLIDDRLQVQDGLLHVGNLCGEKFVARLCLFVLLRRVRIAAAQRAQATLAALPDTARPQTVAAGQARASKTAKAANQSTARAPDITPSIRMSSGDSPGDRLER